MLATLRTACFQLLVSALVAATQDAAAQSKPTLRLTIVPTRYADKVFLKPVIDPSHFHVLLTNISSAPVNIFEEWNEWGYFGLSFEITSPDGRKVRIMKVNRIWDHNFPMTATIAPHGYYVFDVDLSKDWNNFPRIKSKLSQDGILCRMRAIYSIVPTSESLRGIRIVGPEPVWTGTVRSEEGCYSIY